MNNNPQITLSPAALASLKASTEAMEALGTKLGQIGVDAEKQIIDEVSKKFRPIGVSDALAALRSDLLTSSGLSEFGDIVGGVLLAYSESERDVKRAKNNGTLVEYLKEKAL